MHTTLHTVGLQSYVHVSVITKHDVVLNMEMKNMEMKNMEMKNKVTIIADQ